MQRRGITVLVGAVIVALLTAGVMLAPVPYVVMDPGPTVDTLSERDGTPVIDITGGETYESDGELRLTTIRVTPADADITLLDAIRAWLDGEQAVVPKELIYPPGRSVEEVEQGLQTQFTQSQGAAEVAAMRELEFPVRAGVQEVVDGGASDGVLRAGDMITAVNGEEVTGPASLGPLVTDHPVGTTLTLEYLRDGEPGTAEVTTAPDPEDPDIPRIGVIAGPVADHPYEVEIGLEHIGGPSAGLMFALGVIDKLEPEDLTGGQVIAGSGEIDAEGNVGAIGAIPQKLVAAREAGATAFLVPAANCAQAVASSPAGMVLVEVETLSGALAALADLRTGDTPNLCPG